MEDALALTSNKKNTVCVDSSHIGERFYWKNFQQLYYRGLKRSKVGLRPEMRRIA